MKTRNILISLFNFTLAFCLLAFMGVPSIVSVIAAIVVAYTLNRIPRIAGVLVGFITAGQEYKGQELTDIILRPIFQGEMMKEMGVRVILAVKSSIKLTFFETTAKILKAYASGFQGGDAVTVRQKKLELTEFKAEQNFSKQIYKDMVQNEIINKGGIAQNDITGTPVMAARLTLFTSAIKEDLRRKFWLGRSVKSLISGGYFVDTTPDVHYNERQGVWDSMVAQAATSPTAQQIKRVEMSNGAVAQVATHEITGTSGTATIAVNGKTYLVTFATDLTTTASNFVTAHAATLLTYGIVATSSTVYVILTALRPGVPFYTIAGVNVSGNLDTTLVTTTANTVNAALAMDEAIATFKAMVNGSQPVFKAFLNTLANRKKARIWATDTMIENYVDTLEQLPTEKSNQSIIDGIDRPTYRGIPIFPLGVDQYIADDFLSEYPHRAVLGLADNFAMVLNGANDDAELMMWMNVDENENRQRLQMEAGWDFIEPQFLAMAY